MVDKKLGNCGCTAARTINDTAANRCSCGNQCACHGGQGGSACRCQDTAACHGCQDGSVACRCGA